MGVSIQLVSNESEFKEIVKEGVVLVDFFAPWCGPCRMQLAILDSLAPKLPDYVKVVKVNTDEIASLASEYEVSSIPTLFLMKNGNIIQRLNGLQQEETLATAIKQLP